MPCVVEADEIGGGGKRKRGQLPLSAWVDVVGVNME